MITSAGLNLDDLRVLREVNIPPDEVSKHAFRKMTELVAGCMKANNVVYLNLLYDYCRNVRANA